ncbi:MAG TPA: tetratricopeptide repeat protein [Phycisphaerae bacterium]|nr:tetratricopeptide repeat protein [Phycisphaerae bacterium]
MKKAAKVLSVVVLAVAVLTALFVTGWFVHAQDEQPLGQEQQPSLTEQEMAAMSVEAIRAEGNRLRGEGEFETALPLLLEACRRDPTSRGGMLMAGACLASLGRHQEAQQYYQKAMDEKKSGFHSSALYYSAASYKEMGEADRALELLKSLRGWDPMGKWTIQGMALKAELEGQSQAEIDEIVRREEQAARLYHQGKDVISGTNHKNPERLTLLDEILVRFPETGAAVETLRLKGEVLWQLGRREDMCQCYDLLRPILSQRNPPKEVRRLLRKMDCRVAQHRCEQLSNQVLAAQVRNLPVSKQDWDELYARWQVWHRTADPETVVEAEVYRMYFLHMQGDFSTLAEKGREYFTDHYESSPDRMLNPHYKNFAGAAHLETGCALAYLKRYDEALVHFNAIIQMAATTPPLGAEQDIVPEAYIGIAQTMIAMKAPREDVLREIDECLSRYPDYSESNVLVQLRKRMW